MTDPRGVRNNNVLNIEYNERNAWQGLDDPPTDGRFARFVEPQWGLRAAVLILRKYRQRGITSLRGIISTWAPCHENNVDSYLGAVIRSTGWDATHEPDLSDKAETIALLKAMERVECGPAPAGTANGCWLDDAVYEAGFSLAKPMTKSRTIGGTAGAAAATVAGAVVEVATQHGAEIGEAGAVAGKLWPKWAPIVATIVTLAFLGVVFYSRLQARKDGIR